MSEIVIDRCVIAKWILPEADSGKAQQLITRAAATGDQLVALDLIFPEVANAIWKRHHRGIISVQEARDPLKTLSDIPVRSEPAANLVPEAFEIAARYDRSMYDALFIALMQSRRASGITTDEPLFNATQQDFPSLNLLRNM